MKNMSRPLYLYDNVPSGDNCSVLITGPSHVRGPGWTSDGYEEFTDLEWSLIKWSFTEEELSAYFKRGGVNKPPRGWTRMTPRQREKFLIACAANGIHLTIIEWEGQVK